MLRKRQSPTLWVLIVCSFMILLWLRTRSSAEGSCPARFVLAGQAPVPQTAVNKVFGRVYASKWWGDDGRGSGSGSTRAATVVTRQLLTSLVNRHGIHTMIDAPCGALQWTPLLLEPLAADDKCFRYIGLDAAEAVIAQNKERFAGVPYMSFKAADLSSVPLSKLLAPQVDGPSDGAVALRSHAGQPADIIPGTMILCRDALQHVPLELGVAMLRSFAYSGAEFLAVGSYAHDEAGSANWNVKIGGYFAIDLREEPFSLGTPSETLDEQTGASKKGGHGPKLLLIYRLADLRKDGGYWDDMSAKAKGFREMATTHSLEALQKD